MVCGLLGIRSNINDIKYVFLQLETGDPEYFHLTIVHLRTRVPKIISRIRRITVTRSSKIQKLLASYCWNVTYLWSRFTNDFETEWPEKMRTWNTSPDISILLFSTSTFSSFYLPDSSFSSVPSLPTSPGSSLIFHSHLYTTMAQVLDEASSHAQTQHPSTYRPVSPPPYKTERNSKFTSNEDLVIAPEVFSSDTHVTT